MAKISQVDLTPSAPNLFVQQGVPDSSVAKSIESFGTMALDARKGKITAEAGEEARTLKDRFLGRELSGISDQQAALAEEKSSVGMLLGNQDVELDEEATGALETRAGEIAELQEKLALEQERVVQGLISGQDYKINAEKMYYQVLAKSPGLKQEILAAMSGAFGFDPRGAEVQAAFDARAAQDAQKAAQDKLELKQMEENATILKKIGAWKQETGNFRFDYETNMAGNWTMNQSQLQANENKKRLETLYATGEIQDKTKQRNELSKFLTIQNEAAAGSVLFSTVVTGADGKPVNLAMMSGADILKEESLVKDNYLQQLKEKRDEALKSFNLTISMTGDAGGAEKIKPYIDAVNADFERAQAILTSTDLNTIEETVKNFWENRVAVTTAVSTHKLQIDYPDIVKLASMVDLGLGDFLLAEGALMGLSNQVLMDIYAGKRTDLGPDADPALIDAGNKALETLRLAYKTPGGTADNGSVEGGTNMLLAQIDRVIAGDNESIATTNLIPEFLGNEVFLDQLEKIDPEKFEKLMAVAPKALDAVSKELREVVGLQWKTFARNDKGNQPSWNRQNYHLEYNNDLLEVVPNTNVAEQLNPTSVREAKVGFDNKSVRMLKNLVKAYKILGIPANTAAQLISEDLGFSPKDNLGNTETAKPNIDIPAGGEEIATPKQSDSTSSPKEEKKTEEEQEETVEEKTERLLNESLSSSLQTFKQNLASAVNNGASPSDILAIANDLQIGDTTSV